MAEMPRKVHDVCQCQDSIQYKSA